MDKLILNFDKIQNSNGDKSVSTIRLEMQHTMQNFCPVYRSEEKMVEGKKKLLSLINDFNNIKIHDKSLIWNTEVIEALELKNLLSQCIVSIESALSRKESRGAHSRVDYSKRNDQKWLKHSMIWVDEKGSTKTKYRKVNLKTNSKEIKTIEPKARVY